MAGHSEKKKKSQRLSWAAPPPPPGSFVALSTEELGVEAVASRSSSSRDGGGCCRSLTEDTRSLEDYICGCIAPPLNYVLGFFAKPINISLLLYYGGGCLMYRYFNDWTTWETIYFLTVTATTVGYGDYHPEQPLLRLFTCFFALYGITVVLTAMQPIVEMLRGEWRERLMSFVGGGSELDTKDCKLSMKELNQRINYTRRYLLAFVVPAFVQMAGCALYYFFIREPVPSEKLAFGTVDLEGLANGFYYAMITMTTIGYGDITPQSDFARLLAVIYIPVAVLTLADSVADLQMITKRRNIRETDFGARCDECLLRDAVRETAESRAPPTLDPVLTETEFLVDQLISRGLVDEEAVFAIRKHFTHITRKAPANSDGMKVLTPRVVFDEIRERVNSGGEVSTGAELMDIQYSEPTSVNGGSTAKFKWESYEQWREKSWQMRVLAKADEEIAILDGEARRGEDPGDMTMSTFRMM
jgi:voltage-gated potassium channel Kch